MKDNRKTLVIRTHEQEAAFMVTNTIILNKMSFHYFKDWGHCDFIKDNAVLMGGGYKLNVPV